MSKRKKQLPQTEDEVSLSEEQEAYVKDWLDIEPSNLSKEQREYTVQHWNQIIDPDEFYALFPPRKLTPEEIERETEMLEALKEVAEFKARRAELFESIMDIPEPEWIVEGFAVREGITLLYGESGVGKTSLMLQLIASLNEQRKLLSLDVRQAKPLLIEQDENPSLLRSHIERMLPIYPSLEELIVPREPVLWDNTKANFTNRLLEDFIHYSASDLVIIDSLTSLGIEDINHPRCSLVFDRLRILARKKACAFIVIHHPNKAGGIMGTGLLKPKTECTLQLQSGKLIFEKIRGNTPAGALVEPNKDPYLGISQDLKTLVFRVERATFIRERLTQGMPRAELIEVVRALYGGKRDSVGKAVDRASAELKEKGKL